MEYEEFLRPVDFKLRAFAQSLPEGTIGNSLHFSETAQDFHTASLALLCIDDSAVNATTRDWVNFQKIRQAFYKLYTGDWSHAITDLGNFEITEEMSESIPAFRQLINTLLKKQIIPVILGGDASFLFQQYSAYKDLEQLVNVANIDAGLDLGNADLPLDAHNTIGKMIVDQPTVLFNYINLGYQTHLNAAHEITLMDKLHFDAVRLGDLKADLSTAEPHLRNADIVSIDFSSIKSMETGFATTHQPNGFDSLEICGLARYAGISDKVTSFSLLGIAQNNHAQVAENLIGQIIWYFLEGFNNRMHDFPFSKRKDFKKFIVPIDEQEIIFYQSPRSGRWWMEVTPKGLHNKNQRNALIPCQHSDYLEACENTVPERWWKAFRKF